jgi:hypothetical protein
VTGIKAGADPPSVHRDTSRLVAFSDGVFAITITLLVLEIRPPTDDENLLHGLLALWPSYLAYAVSEALDAEGATAISRRLQLALAWLAAGALLGAVLPVLGVAVIAAFNAFYWLPIRGESPRSRP